MKTKQKKKVLCKQCGKYKNNGGRGMCINCYNNCRDIITKSSAHTYWECKKDEILNNIIKNPRKYLEGEGWKK